MLRAVIILLCTQYYSIVATGSSLDTRCTDVKKIIIGSAEAQTVRQAVNLLSDVERHLVQLSRYRVIKTTYHRVHHLPDNESELKTICSETETTQLSRTSV